MKRLALLVMVSVVALIGCGGGGEGGGGGNPNGDGNTQSERKLYSLYLPSTGIYYSSPTLAGNYIYIGTSRGWLYDVASNNYFFKLNLNLTKAWEYPLEKKEVRGGATLDSSGNIYFVIEDGRLNGNSSNSKLYLYSLDNNGVYRWSKIISSSVYNLGMINPAITTDDIIYIGGDKFYALDTSGNEKWTYDNNMTIMNAPIIDPTGNIYFNAAGSINSLYSSSIVSLYSNGTERWRFPTSGESLSSPAFSVDYSKIFVGVGTKVYCLQANTGIKVWEFTPPGMVDTNPIDNNHYWGVFRATPAVDSNNNVYIGTKANINSVFFAIKADGSGLLWKNEIGGDLYPSPVLGNDNTVYVGSEDSGGNHVYGNNLHALDMATGNTKWAVSFSNDVSWSSPVLSDKGILYIGVMDYNGAGMPGGSIYAFRTDSTGLLPNAGSPRFLGGNSSTGRRE